MNNRPPMNDRPPDLSALDPSALDPTIRDSRIRDRKTRDCIIRDRKTHAWRSRDSKLHDSRVGICRQDVPRVFDGGIRGRNPVTWRLGLLILVLVVPACASPYGTLEGVVVGNEAVVSGEIEEIQVIRGGRSIPAELNMILRKDDQIITAPDTRAVLLLLNDAYEVTLDEETEIALENPSIFVRVGKVFTELIKRLEDIREELEIEHEFATAGAEGTQFLFAAAPDGEVEIAVIEGAVRIAPKGEADWEPVVYQAFWRCVIRGPAPPDRLPNITLEEADTLSGWARDVERMTSSNVPSLTGLHERDALALLEESNLGRGRIERRATGETEVGTVISQDPVAGSPIRVGHAVHLVVEDGVQVPALVGATRSTAARRLRSAGLRIGEVSEERSDRRVGTVISQQPSAGSVAQRGDTVDLVLARGCVVPDLTRLTEAAARGRLEDEGLRVGQLLHLEMGETVTSQEPERGTSVECGSSVDFTIGVIG